MKRSKYQIISQILDICVGGACKTKIVYQANLNFRTINPYIDLLTKNGLIKASMGRNVSYETTNRGMKLIDDFKQMNSKLSEL
ncbi:MAG TPA: winged helix-turn-helix domain-containing protein [Methanotrichaceae archaeon]|jgi:predicted transcriptional regulator|nr:winged helix-turn-helix domain-containing protein [Methanotrichaceae archaeon]